MSDRVLFYVQHLLGIGHLKRAAAIAAAMADAGLAVTVAHGGAAVADVAYPGATVHQLPPAGIRGNDFSNLVDADGNDADDAWRARRRDDLLGLARTLRPQVVLFELFPFGRRQFRFELLPLIEEVRTWSPRPAILSSVRDILVRPVKAERETEAADLIARAFDEILVHGDPAFVSFGDSFGPAERIADRLRYTGYVSSEIRTGGEPPPAEGPGEVIVSAGGGAAGLPLMQAALAARPQTKAAALDWRLLTGPRLPEASFQAVVAQAAAAEAMGGGTVTVERFRPDFPQLLRTAALSVSQGGYNTTIDLLRAGVPAIVVPFGAEEETEQEDRARRLAERGYLQVLEESALGTLAQAIDAALADAPRRRAMAPVDFALDGAARTAEIVALHARRRSL
ncbi:glycosyl transferase [Aureimonas sp. SA4125]|uniref:glycosyltransferase family protein n=1 Tax=Aureimonas sp. SA4125 TaxID=2826993 RepID=UPI001CC3D0EC|nr:glycosyltransferase [Aureimonas sp. SA4125]BDA82565.1 glycosyl transferase [Aureimonas sp. SA4125]